VSPERRVYLSGGMEYADDEGRTWRADLQAWLEREAGWSVFNPSAESDRLLRAEFPGTSLRSLKASDPGRYREIVRRIVMHDCREIAERSDIVVCRWDDAAMRGAGTKGELTIARYFGKPVYLVTAVPPADIPGWVLGCVTEVFPDFDALRRFLSNLPRL
jgi:hypothetical protein